MSVTLRPMPEERLIQWISAGYTAYLNERIQAGEAPDVAKANADRSHEQNFPDGRPLASHRIFDVVVGEEVVGCLWIAPQLEGSDSWWIYEIEILEPFRRRGYARAAIELGHAEARELGATSMGLNVFGFNTGARELYEKLGYDITAVQMKRAL